MRVLRFEVVRVVALQVTGIDVDIACITIFIVCVFYTSMGGFKAVIWTDVFQVQCSVVQCRTMQCIAVLYSVVYCSAVQNSVLEYSILQCCTV